MGWGAVIGGALGSAIPGVGTAIGAGLGGLAEQQFGNDYNSAQASANRDWQANLSGSSYQRAMADMKAAGLNPMLAYSQGGASVPTGATASYAATADSASAVSASASAQQAATASRVGDATVSKIAQEIGNLRTDNDRTLALIENLRVEYQNLVKSGYNLTDTGNQIRAMVDKLKAEVPLINNQAFQTELQGFLTRAQTYLTTSQGSLTDIDVRAASAFGELGKTVGQLEPFLRLIWNALIRR